MTGKSKKSERPVMLYLKGRLADFLAENKADIRKKIAEVNEVDLPIERISLLPIDLFFNLDVENFTPADYALQYQATKNHHRYFRHLASEVSDYYKNHNLQKELDFDAKISEIALTFIADFFFSASRKLLELKVTITMEHAAIANRFEALKAADKQTVANNPNRLTHRSFSI